jgi:hypothetical protein
MVHPRSGFYTKDDLEYVSVSSVLGRTSELFNPNKIKGLEIWRQMEPDWQEIMERAQRRGTIIHSEVELSLMGDAEKHKMEAATMDEIMNYNIHEYITYLAPVLDLIKEQNFKHGVSDPSFLMEEELFCDLGYAGTADLRLTWDGQYTIWDWKTVRSYKEPNVKKKAKSMSHYKEAEVQIASYALAHNLAVKKGELDKPITQGVICVCYDWREPHVHVLNKQELKAAAQEFIERFKVFCSLENLSLPRAAEAVV